MKIVIDIPDNFNLENEINTVDNPVIRKALKNGKPLSEHYGDLIDRKELFERLKDNCAGRCEFCSSWSVEGCKNILNCTALVKSTERED